MKLINALDGLAEWPPPIWLMRQAGRYLPEYRAMRASAGDFLALCTNPALAAEVTLQPIRRFGFDAAILFSDILILPWALGRPLRFADGEGPLLPPLTAQSELAALNPERAMRATQPVMETLARVRAALPPETALIGFAGGPFTVACYMLDGRGGGEFPRTRALAYQNLTLVMALLDLLTDATIGYLQAQIEAGADCLMLFESWAGILPPAQFRAFVTDPTRRIVAALRAHSPGVRIIGFPRRCGLMLGEYRRMTAVTALGLDESADPAAAIAACPGGVFQGNLDPLLLRLGGEPLARGVDAVLAGFRGHPHIFNLGHGIAADTDPEHVSALVARVRAG